MVLIPDKAYYEFLQQITTKETFLHVNPVLHIKNTYVHAHHVKPIKPKSLVNLVPAKQPSRPDLEVIKLFLYSCSNSYSILRVCAPLSTHLKSFGVRSPLSTIWSLLQNAVGEILRLRSKQTTVNLVNNPSMY